MSSHPASSFRSGVNRVLGTVMGATYGMALMEWLKVRDHTAIVLLLTLWVLFCGLHRTSKTYGEAAVSAALTVRRQTGAKVIRTSSRTRTNEALVVCAAVGIRRLSLWWARC